MKSRFFIETAKPKPTRINLAVNIQGSNNNTGKSTVREYEQYSSIESQNRSTSENKTDVKDQNTGCNSDYSF